MKVSIVPGTKKKGLIFKTEIHTVKFSVQFSEEEQAQIKAAGVRNYSLLRDVTFISGAVMDLEVFFLEGNKEKIAQFSDQTEAQRFTMELKGALANLKDHLETYGEKSEAETFEL